MRTILLDFSNIFSYSCMEIEGEKSEKEVDKKTNNEEEKETREKNGKEREKEKGKHFLPLGRH